MRSLIIRACSLKDTTEAEKNAIIKEYTEFVEETLDSTELNPFQVEASFGVPQTVVDAQGNEVKNARTGVVAAGLIQESDLTTKPVIYVPTLEDKFKEDQQVIQML